MDILVRKADECDIEVIADNIVSMGLETNQEKLPYDNVLQGVKKPFSNPEVGFYIVAESNNNIIGSLLITYEWSDWRNGNYWWIQSVYVSPKYRKQGVYTKMYEYIKSISGNAKDIKLYTNNDNETAKSVYKKLGMKEDNSITYHAGIKSES